MRVFISKMISPLNNRRHTKASPSIPDTKFNEIEDARSLVEVQMKPSQYSWQMVVK